MRIEQLTTLDRKFLSPKEISEHKLKLDAQKRHDKWARDFMSERQQKALIALAEAGDESEYGDEVCVYTRGIAKRAKMSQKDARNALRALVRKGYVQLVRGLIDDNGMLAGSGYQITRIGKQLI